MGKPLSEVFERIDAYARARVAEFQAYRNSYGAGRAWAQAETRKRQVVAPLRVAINKALRKAGIPQAKFGRNGRIAMSQCNQAGFESQVEVSLHGSGPGVKIQFWGERTFGHSKPEEIQARLEGWYVIAEKVLAVFGSVVKHRDNSVEFFVAAQTDEHGNVVVPAKVG